LIIASGNREGLLEVTASDARHLPFSASSSCAVEAFNGISWKHEAKLNVARAWHSCVIWQERIACLGGTSASASSSDEELKGVFHFPPSSHSNRAEPRARAPSRHSLVFVHIGELPCV